MRKVLDDDLLGGPHGVELHLRSARAAWQVESYDQAVGLIERTHLPDHRRDLGPVRAGWRIRRGQ
jgi:hypothetical protein